jgi:nitrite reductase/ring-hydroxylating ferredoxin subunit
VSQRFLSVNGQCPQPAAPCEPPDPSRREFFGHISAAALAALIGVELLASDASAVPLTNTSGAQGAANERTYPTPASDGVSIDREAEVILIRFHQQALAFNLACPHENTALRWRQEDGRFQCPRHGSKYQPDGTFISGRATRSMDRFAIRREGDSLIVDLTHLYRSDQQKAEWTAAVVTL